MPSYYCSNNNEPRLLPVWICQRHASCKEQCNDQALIQSSTTPDPGHRMGKWLKHNKTSHTGEPRGQPFPSRWPQGCKTQTRLCFKENTNIKKVLQKKYRLGMVSLKITGGWVSALVQNISLFAVTVLVNTIVQRLIRFWLFSTAGRKNRNSRSADMTSESQWNKQDAFFAWLRLPGMELLSITTTLSLLTHMVSFCASY